MPYELTLVIGGIKSGKSEHAERLIRSLGSRIVYLATGSCTDGEMRARIEAHVRRRPDSWRTVEASSDLALALENVPGPIDGILLDDLGGLVSQAVMATVTYEDCQGRLLRESQAFLSLIRSRALPVVVVTSEVGLSLVPLSELGRRFADALGETNQHWAKEAAHVVLVAAGIPLALK